MTRPTRFLNRMILFVAGVAALAILLHDKLASAFAANPFINGLIAATLLIGTGYVFRQVLMMRPEIDWAEAQAADLGDRPAPEAGGGPEPRILAPVAALMSERTGNSLRLTTVSLRSLLDGVASRLEEGREISRYMIGLLIFLGLLGTFWGLLDTIGAISRTIGSLTVDTTNLETMFDTLKKGLEGPLSGMATAFSSSLFGLAGSVALGFLDLQLGQAQNRFYTDVEDWLTAITKLTAPEEGAGSRAPAAAGSPAPSTYVSALLEQTADELSDLNRLLRKGEEERAQSERNIRALTETMSALADTVKSGHKTNTQLLEAQRETRALLEKLVAQGENRENGLDEASRDHLRNLDLGIKHLGESQERALKSVEETLRSEVKLLSRTLSRRIDEATQESGESAPDDGEAS